MKRWFLVFTLLLVPTLALAGAPVNGVYNTTDLGGMVLPGNFSESWVAPDFHQGQVGNAIHAASWDGAVLGTQWTLACPAISAPPTLLSDTVVGGNGFRQYSTTYDGGAMWLSSTGPWGDEDYTADVLSMTVLSTHQYYEGALVGVVSNITIFGAFRGYAPCFEYVISNAAILGNTGMMPLPATYPAFVDAPTCDVGPQTGAWGNITQATLSITGDCSVGTETRTWGSLKARF